MKEVFIRLQTISGGAQNCKKQAQEILDSADLFLKTAQELYVCCRAENADVHTQREDVLIKKKLAELEIKDSRKREEDIKAEMDQMKKDLDDAQDTYKRTLDQMPTGYWKIKTTKFTFLPYAVADSIFF